VILRLISSIARSKARTIVADGRTVPIVISRHPRARGYRLRIGRDGEARLTMPTHGSERRAMAWALDQAEWIADQLARMDSRTCRLGDGCTFPLEGRDVTIRWTADGPRSVREAGDLLLVGGPPEHAGERVLRWLKARARKTLSEETHAIAAAHGLAVSAVGIGDPSSRWGSCSSSGAIRYSWRLILAPPEVRIATVAHEVAHLKHLDHSPAFHAFHRAICPSDTVAARAWLKRHGAMLHGVGV
jgi:predicted metal-dependent hydrolase